jgi:trimethylamine:corrinoid methyltransferase-like protein
MADKANAKVRKILETHQPEPLSEGITKALDAVIQRAEDRSK